MTDETVHVEHNRAEKRFEVEQDGHTAVLEYVRVRRSLVLAHTGVPDAIEGRGIGSALARAALEYVRDEDLVAVPMCPFVRSFIRRHPEYLELVGFGARGDRMC